MSEEQFASTAAPDTAATVHERDLLACPPEEAREMEQFVEGAIKAPGRIALYTILGVLILAVTLLYFRRFDVVREQNQWQRFPAVMDRLLENQLRKDAEVYVVRKSMETEVPSWPQAMYGKLRQDGFLAAGAMLLLALVFIRSERARLHRNDLLVYRSMAREVERLKRRVNELEKNQPVTADTGKSPANS